MSESVLLIESDPDLRRVITLTLRQEGFDILEAVEVSEAYKYLEDESPEILLLELDIPHGHNGALIEAYRDRQDSAAGNGKVVLTTTLRPGDAWRKKYQPDAVIYKPFDVRQLCNLVKAQLRVSPVQTL